MGRYFNDSHVVTDISRNYVALIIPTATEMFGLKLRSVRSVETSVITIRQRVTFERRFMFRNIDSVTTNLPVCIILLTVKWELHFML